MGGIVVLPIYYVALQGTSCSTVSRLVTCYFSHDSSNKYEFFDEGMLFLPIESEHIRLKTKETLQLILCNGAFAIYIYNYIIIVGTTITVAM